MACVTRVFDSTGIPAVIHATSDQVFNVATLQNNDERHPTQRGTLEALIGGSVSCFWWRQGGDLHVLAFRGAAAPFAAVQRAVVKFPQQCVAIALVAFTDSLLGAVGVTEGGEVLCVRLQLGFADLSPTSPASSSLYIRALPDVFTSLCREEMEQGASVTAATIMAGDGGEDSFLRVAIGFDNGCTDCIVFDDAGESTAQRVPIRSSAIVALAFIKASALLVVADSEGAISLCTPEGSVAEIARVDESQHGVISGLVAEQGGGSEIVIVASSAYSDAVLLRVSAAGETFPLLSLRCVSQPTPDAFVASIFIEKGCGASVCLVGWSGCALWSIPTTCLSAFRSFAAETVSITARCHFDVAMAESDVRTVWNMPESPMTETFWFSHSSAPSSATFLATVDVEGPAEGEVSLFVADSPSAIVRLVGSSVFTQSAPTEDVYTHAEGDGPSIFVAPLLPTAAKSLSIPKRAPKAFAAGLAVLNSIPGSVYSLHYIFQRALACPNRFANYSEFSELRTDAILACLDIAEVTEEDVRDALDFISACEDTGISPLYTTSMYTYGSVVCDLSSRLIYLIIVFSAWVCTASASFADSDVTIEVAHRAEILAASIRAVHALALDTCEILSADVARSEQSDEAPLLGQSDAGSVRKNIHSTIVNELCQIGLGDVLDMVLVARMLSSILPHGGAGGRAAGHWVSVLMTRNPILAHFHIASAISAGSSRGTQSVACMAEAYGVSAQLSLLPHELGKQVLGALGMYTQQHFGALPQGVVAVTAAERLAADADALADAYPALIPKLYRVLLLRRLVGGVSLVSLNSVEAAFVPDFIILRRYVSEKGGMHALEALLTTLSVDISFVTCRSALDEQRFADALACLGTANRELSAAIAQCATNINMNPLVTRRDALPSYVALCVDRALAEGKACALVSACLLDMEVSEMVSQRLYWLSFVAYVHPTSTSGGSSVGAAAGSSTVARLTPAQAEASEVRRFTAACALNDFLCQRHAYGLCAHSLYSIASAARTASQPTANTAAYVTQLLALALAALKAIPQVPPPPPHLVKEADGAKQQSTVRQSMAGGPPLSVAVGPGAPHHNLLTDLRPMSARDIPLLQKRLFQSRCEQKLQRIPRNVVKGPWREDAADRSRIERLVDELLTVRLWTDALRMSQLAGLDANLVYQCESADLAQRNYLQSAALQAQWDCFIDKLLLHSTLLNGFMPLRKALSAALLVNHRHVPPRLKQELASRDLGALITILLGSGKLQVSGDELTRTNSMATISSFCGQADGKKLAGSIILEVLLLAIRYIRATDEAVAKEEENARSAALEKYGLSPKAFISYPLLERIDVIAQTVVTSSRSAASLDSRRREICDAATTFVALLSKRNAAGF